MPRSSEPSPLILGTANLGMPYGISNGGAAMDAGEASALLDAAWAHGIRRLDTANAYEGSERRIGAWSRSTGRSFTVISKAPSLGRIADGDVACFLEHACLTSKADLRENRLAGFLLHDADDICRKSVQAGLLELRNNSLVSEVGVSIYEPKQGLAALETGAVDLLQVPYNLLDRKYVTSGLAERCQAAGVRVDARSVYLQGVLVTDAMALPGAVADLRPVVAKLQIIARDSGHSVHSLALNFVLEEESVSGVVIGAQTPGQLAQSVATYSMPPLGPALVSKLTSLSECVHPEWTDPRKWPLADQTV